MTIRLFIVSIVVAAVVGAIGYYKLVFEPAFVREMILSAPQPTLAVSTEEARTEQWRHRIPSIGTIRATKGIEVAAQVDGIVTDILFTSGEEVEQGEKLVQIDDSVEQADLKSNLAMLQSAQFEFERQQQLFDRKTASKAAFDQALAARDSAAAAVERTRAVIQHKAIQAPFSGRLGIRKVDPGQYITAGQELVTLQSIDPIYVDFTVPEHEIGLVQPGQAVELRVDTYQDRLFEGTIETVDARVAQETRTLLVRANLANPDGALLPGMFANVAVLAGEPQEVVTVPRTAVTYSLYGDSIYVVKPAEAPGRPGAPEIARQGALGLQASAQEGSQENAPAEAEAANPQVYVVERRQVTLGETQGDRIAVTDGVEAGEMVITSGQIRLQPGMRVTVDNSNPLVPRASPPRE